VLSVAGVISAHPAQRQLKSCRSDNAYFEPGRRYPEFQTPLNEKLSRTPAQKKIDSQLLYALKQKRGITKGIPTERIELEVDPKGRPLVDITADVTPQVKAQIRKLGGTVISEDASLHTIRARLALEKLEALANRNDVRFIAPAAQSMNSGKPN